MGESVECYVVGRIYQHPTSNMASVDNDTQLQKTAELVHWVNSVPLGLTICALGILGNSVSMLVWVRIHRKLRELNTTILYFVIMAVIDSGLLWMFIFKDSIPALQPEFIKTYGFCVLFPLFYLFLMLSIWVVVAVTVDRYLLLAQQYRLSIRGHTLCLAGLLVGGFVINLPHFFSLKPVLQEDDDPAGEETWKWNATDFGQSDSGQRYEFWVHCIFLILAPWLTIAGFNAAILKQIYEVSRHVRPLIGHAYDPETASTNVTSTRKISTSSLGAARKISTSTVGVQSTRKISEMSTGQPTHGIPSRDNLNSRMTRLLLTVTFTFLVLLLTQCIVQCFWMQGFHKDDEN